MNSQKRLAKIAKHIQRLNADDACFDDFLNALDETTIEATREKLETLLSFVDERREDIKAEKTHAAAQNLIASCREGG